jgi:FlaA1/EpsC-like NDP-sugar epimerase
MIRLILKGGKLSRWSVFLVDVFICTFVIYLAYLLRFNFQIPQTNQEQLLYSIPFVLFIRIISFVVFKTYSGVILHTSTEDAIRILLAVTSGTVVILFSNLVSLGFTEKFIVPHSILIIDYMTSMFFLTGFRIFIKVLYLELTNAQKERSNILIYGAGQEGIITKRTLERDPRVKYKIIGFIDEHKHLSGMKLEGVNVYHPSANILQLIEDKNINLLIFSKENIKSINKKKLIDLCLKNKVRVLNVPPMQKWINGELSFNQIRQVKIEDLLGRTPIQLDKTMISQDVKDKRVLVTGAAGSIGSELVRQLLPFKPSRLIMLDQAESDIYNLDIELRRSYVPFEDFEVVIGDVRNKDRMGNVFKTFDPEVVFHAAAYKHVPLMESNPSEAILTNILGTKNVADLAVEHNAKKFVLISTDKAVNPTNVMGASKRIAEIYVQSLNETIKDKAEHTSFVTTRFGNVLGSNGSVIPLFRKQIMNGGPITVTHPDVTRFFMTIPEACQLVLEAGAMGKGGEIFIFDMGTSVKIIDLAKKMIELSGLELDRDIKIEFTGLREGEKLYEELLSNAENTISTHHDKIMIAKVREYSFEHIDSSIEQLIGLFDAQENMSIVRKMKDLVPEFQSNNSVFKELD